MPERDLGELLGAAAGPVALPPELRRRVAVMLAGEPLADLDLSAAATPVALPADVAGRVEARLLARPGELAGPAPRLAPAPAPNPSAAGRVGATRLPQPAPGPTPHLATTPPAPPRPRRTPPRRWWIAAAAISGAAAALALTLQGGVAPTGGRQRVALAPPAAGTGPAPLSTPAGRGGPAALAGAPEVTATRTADPLAADPPPPFANLAPALPPGGRTAPGQARIGITGADPAELAGFQAYLDSLNRQGLQASPAIRLVAVDAAHPAGPDVLITANLGDQPITINGAPPEWVQGAVLETLSAPAEAVSGPLSLDLASSPERQADLLADHLVAATDLLARPAPTVAVYVAGAGAFRRQVPSHLLGVLTAAGVTVRKVEYTPGQRLFVPADAALLSMDGADARAFATDATAAGYRPRLGFGGIFSAYDDGLLGRLPAPLTVVTPYAADAVESRVLGDGLAQRGLPLSAAALHGWADAKAVAMALYIADPRTPAQMAQVIQTLPSNALGLAPFGLRPLTHERIPDGLLMDLGVTGFVRRGDFLTDPRI